MHSHLRLNCVIKLSFRASAKSNRTSRVAATTQTGRYRPSNDTRASGAMTTIRPAAIGARLREVLTLYYPLLPRQPRICNHQLSRRPPRHWPPSAIPGSTLHSRASHVSRSALPSRPDLGGIHLIPRTPPRPARPPATPGLPGALPPAGHHDLHGPGRRRARLPGQPGARLRGATPARSRHHRPGAIAGPGQRRRRRRAGARDPAGHAGQPGPLPLPVRARAGVRRPHPPPHRPGRAQDRPGLRHRARRGPEGYWTYDEERGFTILPGRSLIEGLRRATQPEASGQLYAFSCYRATEYVTVLGIAQELEEANPRWRATCSASGKARGDVRALSRHLPARIRLAGRAAAAALLRAGRPALVPQSGLRFVRRGRL